MATSSRSFQIGLPPGEFFPKAWASEPLTEVLEGTNIPFALPMPDPDVSLIVKEDNQVVGQCSANRAVKYWTHVENLSLDGQNLSTRIFVAIHKKAVKAEQEYLAQVKESHDQALHSAGIAVLPEYRGRQLGIEMRAHQIALCRENKMTTLFCETTNRFSAATVERFHFTKIAQYPYKELAQELDYADLSKLNDSFTVWCLKA